MEETKQRQPHLGILLAPFGSGKTAFRAHFAEQLGKRARTNIQAVSIDDYVYASSGYQAALAQVESGAAQIGALRSAALRNVRPARRRCDSDLEEFLARRISVLLEEPARTERWAPWFVAGPLAAARAKGYAVVLYYLARHAQAAWTACLARAASRESPAIPRAEFDSCRVSALGAFVALAPRADRAELWWNAGRGLDPQLVCYADEPRAEASWRWPAVGAALRLRGSADLPRIVNPGSGKERAALDAVRTMVERQRPCAWATLVMGGPRYLPGALALGQSLRLVGTAHDTVCMVTPEIPDSAVRALAEVFTAVRRVPVISRPSRLLPGRKQRRRYDAAFVSTAYTKWNCLGFAEYAKIAFVDADVVFQHNPDALFQLCAPAGTFSNPWSPDQLYGRLAHGDRVAGAAVRDALHLASGYVAFGSLVLLAPSTALFGELKRLLAAADTYGRNLRTISGTDELLLAELYGLGEWRHIDPTFHRIPWKEYEPGAGTPPLVDAIGVHYFGAEKPWEMARDEWDDLSVWWRVWATLAPELQKLIAKPA